MSLLDEDALDALAGIAEEGQQTPVSVYRSSDVADPSTGQVGSNDYGDDVEEAIENEDASARSKPVWSGLGWFHSELQTNVTDADGQVATIDLHEVRLPRTADIRSGDEVQNGDTGDWFRVVDVNDGDTYRVQTRANLRRRE